VASLILVRSGGSVVGACDATCYDARHETCVCTGCGGANHGAGLEQAITNTRRLHAQWLERARTGLPDVSFELDASVTQLALFPLENP
jgi:hypothetical protein